MEWGQCGVKTQLESTTLVAKIPFPKLDFFINCNVYLWGYLSSEDP